MVYRLNNQKEKVAIVGIRLPHQSREFAQASIGELRSLVETAGGEIEEEYFQEIKSISPATLIGSGKVDEISERLSVTGCNTVVFDEELTPAQNRNLADKWNVKVIDRTALILDIFARRARTKEGKLQVELAQMQYRLPRLKGSGIALSQQAGYIGNRGPGETKLEVDRRRIRERITRLKNELGKVRQHREIHRKKREGVPIPTVSLIGYTNAGKSTLINKLTGSKVFVEDKLFATLDPTVRRLTLKSGRDVLIADTVGFIRRLPHQLIDAFKATFEEVERSDLLVHVIDISTKDAPRQIETVSYVLNELSLNEKPILKIFNKSDIPERHVRMDKNAVEISALKGSGLDKMLDKIDQILTASFESCLLQVPYSDSAILDDLYRHAHVKNVDRQPQYMILKADLSEKLKGKYKKYIIT